MNIDYIGIMASIMAVCAVFVTVTPVIDRFRDRRLNKLEKKTKSLISQMEKHEEEIQMQKKSLENIQNVYLNLFKTNKKQ
jgi:hypothetical protein